MRARWKRREPGTMNDGERAWSERLEAISRRVQSGNSLSPALYGIPAEVEEFRFEGMVLKLAKLTRYTPDFFVLLSDGTIEFHEVKGSWKAPGQEDSRVKIKVAAEMFPWFVFRSVVVKRRPKSLGGGWDFQVEQIG